MGNKRIKYILIFTILAAVLGGLLVAINILFLGKVSVTTENTGISYQLDGRGLKHSDSSVISWVIPGRHSITAVGTITADYKPKTYEITVERGKTVDLNISLEPTSSNVDYPSPEFNVNNSSSLALIDTLPITNKIGSIYFDYSESEYHVDLGTGVSHEAALKWFKDKGVTIDDSMIMWGSFVPPDGN